MSLKTRFDLVIFDWAGTMVDFGCMAPVRALIDAFAQEGVEIHEIAARRDMGKAKADHVRGMLAHPDVEAAWRAKHGRAPNERDMESLIEVWQFSPFRIWVSGMPEPFPARGFRRGIRVSPQARTARKKVNSLCKILS